MKTISAISTIGFLISWWFFCEFGNFPYATSEEDIIRFIDLTMDLDENLWGDHNFDAID